jgi:hypothetical protein
VGRGRQKGEATRSVEEQFLVGQELPSEQLEKLASGLLELDRQLRPQPIQQLGRLEDLARRGKIDLRKITDEVLEGEQSLPALDRNSVEQYVDAVVERLLSGRAADEATREQVATIWRGFTESMLEFAERKERLRALGVLAVRNAQVESLRAEIDVLVAEARSQGATWADIGTATGVSAQSANQKWNPKVRERRQRSVKRDT